MRVAPLTGKAQRAVALATGAINVWEGSVRSGKTVSSLLAWLGFLRTGPAGNVILVAKTERTARRNIIDPLIEMLGVRRVRYNAGTGVLELLNRRVYIVGANDERAQDKIRGLTLVCAYVDEASTMPESFWAMLITRLSVDGSRVYATTNPEGPRHWLLIDYLKRAALHLTGDNTVRHIPIDPDDDQGSIDLHRFSFRLTDNPNLPQAYLDSVQRTYTGLWRRRYILGEWVAADGAVYEMFDPDLHVVDIVPPITRWLALGVDYGTTNPFTALLLGQGADHRLYVTNEYGYDSRVTRRAKTDAEYSKDLVAWLDRVRVPHSRPPFHGVRPQWICVDPSAASFVHQLHRDGLTPTPARNDVLDGIRMVGSLFTADRLRIHRSCTGLLDELPGYVWDPKKTELGLDMPIKLDDHYCLAEDTPVLTASGERPIAEIQPGDLVLTRSGWQPVTAAMMTASSAATYLVQLSNGRSFEATGDHPIWVTDRGWRRIDALRYADRLLSWETSISSSSTTSASVDIPTGNDALNASTTPPGLQIDSVASNVSTRRSGWLTPGGLSRLATTSITPTVTRSTTTRPTSSAFQPMSTAPTTATNAVEPAPTRPPSGWPTSTPFVFWRPSGTAAAPAESGIEPTPSKYGRTSSPAPNDATSATLNIKAAPFSATIGSAPTPASRPFVGPAEWTTRTGAALGAAPGSPLTGTPAPSAVPVHVLSVTALHNARPVWNLSVDNASEFFAAGVLVHNCDSLRYAVATVEAQWRALLRRPILTLENAA